MTLLTFFNYIAQASVLIPVIAGMLVYKKLTKSFRLFFWFFVLSIVSEVQARLTNIIFHNNMPGFHVFTMVEFLVFSTIYYLYFQKNSIMRPLIAVNTIIFLCIAFVDIFYFKNILEQPILSRSYSSAFIVLYTLICFYHLLRKDDLQYSWVYPMFWVCVGALVYFAPNMLYFMLKKFLLTNAPDIEWISYHTHAAFNIIGNLLFAQSFRCFRKTKALS